MNVVLATKNPHKLIEIQAILAQQDIQLVLPEDLGVYLEVEETGATFEENSLLKAQALLEATGIAAMADDSGLMVDALKGAPGVYSARYGGDACLSDKDRLELLLSHLEHVPEAERTAKFVCVITMLYPDGKKLVARGECPGRICRTPQGNSGFGYDPVFYVPEEGCTFAQMNGGRKNAISHRARALAALCAMLTKEGQHDHQ